MVYVFADCKLDEQLYQLRRSGEIVEDQENLAVLDTLATKIASAKKIFIPHAGHLPRMEKPDEFNHLVLDFLSKR